MQDPSPTSLALAVDMGAGALDPGGEPRLVVVAAPPDVAGKLVAQNLRRFDAALVTDVASVKHAVLADVLGELGEQAPELLERYAGSHPMAGRARSGAGSAHADLFYGRPWVIVPTEWSGTAVQLAVRELAVDLGAVPVTLAPEDHDEAVALVSHVPQLVASLLAARLADAPPEALALAGQGLRDTTRIAASDPELWTRILAGNAKPVAAILEKIRDDLDALVERLADPQVMPGMPVAPGATAAINRTIAAGNRGAARIPGKHGGAPRRWGVVEVLVPDKPGELGRLFSDLGDAEVNLEDLTLDHSAEQPVGMARLMVAPDRVQVAAGALAARGWRVAGWSQR